MRDADWIFITPAGGVDEAWNAVCSAIRNAPVSIKGCVYTSSPLAVYSSTDDPAEDGYTAESPPKDDGDGWGAVENELGMLTSAAGIPLAVVIPGMLMGPTVLPEVTDGARLLRAVTSTPLSFLPELSLTFSDVRDTAAANLLCIQSPATHGQRFIVASGSDTVGMEKLRALIHRKHPHLEAPKGVIRSCLTTAAMVGRMISGAGDSTVQGIKATLGSNRHLRHSRTRRALGLRPSSVRQTVSDTVDDLIDMGLLEEPAVDTTGLLAFFGTATAAVGLGYCIRQLVGGGRK